MSLDFHCLTRTWPKHIWFLRDGRTVFKVSEQFLAQRLWGFSIYSLLTEEQVRNHHIPQVLWSSTTSVMGVCFTEQHEPEQCRSFQQFLSLSESNTRTHESNSSCFLTPPKEQTLPPPNSSDFPISKQQVKTVRRRSQPALSLRCMPFKKAPSIQTCGKKVSYQWHFCLQRHSCQ